MTQFLVGDRIKITSVFGTAFYQHNLGKVGTIGRISGIAHHVEFDDGGADYGRASGLTLVEEDVKDAQGFILNTRHERPVARGVELDVLYNDGTLILNLPVGVGQTKRASNNDNEYAAISWSGECDAGIKAYRFPADRPNRLITHAEMKKGMKIRLVSEGDRQHQHWGFRLGHIITCADGGPTPGCDRNWAGWEWELVEDAPASTFEERLAELRAELDQIKTKKAAAEEEVAAAKVKVAAADRERVVLIQQMATFGIQFIGEQSTTVTAQDAFEAGDLDIGMTLLCVVSEDESEHTPGERYKVIHRDRDDRREFKLESDDGCGYWVANESLDGYVVVVE